MVLCVYATQNESIYYFRNGQFSVYSVEYNLFGIIQIKKDLTLRELLICIKIY